MYEYLKDFAANQSRAEVHRQFAVSNLMEVQRRLLALLAFALASIFLPIWICAVLAVIDTACEMLALRIMRDVDPPSQPGRYLAMLACFSLAGASYCMVPVLVWQLDDPFSKAYAVGTTILTLVQLSTVRTVHLPLALVGVATVTVATLLGNGYFWLHLGNLTGLTLSTICVLGAAYFSLITMLSVHALHDEMVQGRAAAQAADLAKSRFLAQMSHELRTPLNAILGMGNAELSGAANAETKLRLTTLVQSARSLSVLLDDILDMSAVQAGQLPIRPTALDLRAEISSTIALFGQQISDAGLALDLRIQGDLPEFGLLDGQRLRQCLSNVLSNAVKHTRTGTIAVEVLAPVATQLAIKVSDTGPGVAAEMREMIFEPFHRGQTTVTGTGLGLSISRTLARRMGGDLVLLPSGAGAQFLLTIAMQPAQRPAAVAQASAADLAGLRVLVVDDISSNRFVAATYLRILGALPVEAADGPAALDLLARDPPDVVLLDMLMPGMDGLATLALIRAMAGPVARVPVIAMTADATEDHRRHYLAAGLDGYVSKPLSAERLVEVIRHALPARG